MKVAHVSVCICRAGHRCLEMPGSAGFGGYLGLRHDSIASTYVVHGDGVPAFYIGMAVG